MSDRFRTSGPSAEVESSATLIRHMRSALIYIGGVLCFMVVAAMALFLIAGAAEDSLSAGRAIVFLAIAVIFGWAGYQITGISHERPSR